MTKRQLKSLVAASMIGLPLAAMPAGVALAQSAALTPAETTQNAVLVADSLRVEGRNLLIASGNVEVFHDGQRLRASKVTYDRKEDKLTIEGPITLDDGKDVQILAGSAQLDSKFENGMVLGARMIIDQRVQLAANQLSRVGGRYSQLYKVAATSCRVCETGRPPLWQIRAQKTTHDTEERQLYFDNAQLRVLDVPILWLPRLRLPDPTLDRASGFLIPSLKQSSQLGLGIRIPYFIRMGDHRDLTLTPYVSPQTRTLELRYRQAFRNGRITVEGAVSDDSLEAASRGYLFGEGQFDLARDFKLDLQVQAVTDNAYLLDYDYSTRDRLASEVAISRVRRDEYMRGALTTYQTLREDEDNSQLPTIVTNGYWEKRYQPLRFGGELTTSAAVGTLFRYSDEDILGRDVRRANIAANWRRDWTLAYGLRMEYALGVAIDGFSVAQDSSSSDTMTQVTPSTQVTLRWPLMKQNANGVRHLLEPMAMVGWVGGSNDGIPNEESTRSELDDGNLLSLSRFTGEDRRERGAQAALGLRWTRQSDRLWSSLTLGQIYRDEAQSEFSQTSGLSGRYSDLLVAGHLKLDSGFAFSARTLLDNGLEVDKAEARADWSNAYSAVSASYVWLGKDPVEDRTQTISEWAIDGRYRFARHWTGSTEWRYDVAGDSLAEAKLGLNYRNECVIAQLSLSRRFTTSTNVDASTSVDFTVNLTGFTTGKTDNSYTRSCRN